MKGIYLISDMIFLFFKILFYTKEKLVKVL